MAAPARRLTDEEIRGVLLQARNRGQGRTFNDVLSYWGGSFGWQGYEADIARARTIFEEGPDVWTRSESESESESVLASRLAAATGKNEPAHISTAEPPPTPLDAAATAARRVEAPAPATPPLPPSSSRPSVESQRPPAWSPAPATATAPPKPSGIPTIIWLLLGALGIAVLAYVLYRLLRGR